MTRKPFPKLYSHSLALLTDFYQLTMCYSYWKASLFEKEAVFHHFFRRAPFSGGFTIACGLEVLINYLENFKFEPDDLKYLESIEDKDGEPLFEKAFLDYLGNMKFSCSLDAVKEGTVVFPYEPLIRIQGPLIQCQILESVILNLINFSSLIATKAARICLAAKGDEVVEFGLRRAQGIDGAMTASRSAYIGGCSSTSNVLAAKAFGIPVKGTHSHSFVMVFNEELEAFKQYAECLPNHTVFLVDTYDTVQGVKNAIEVGKLLKKKGKRLAGIRLDSGDLNYLSIISRKLLDEAGFQDAEIIASNELDEHVISELKKQGAKIQVWGVGTNLVTGHENPALDGVYKLSAIRDPKSDWVYKLKLSEQMIKTSNPGILQVKRFFKANENIADAIYDVEHPPKNWTITDPFDSTKQKWIKENLEAKDLLVPIFRDGKLVYEVPTLEEVRKNVKKELDGFYSGIKRFLNPHQYFVGMEKSLYDKKRALILEIRKKAFETQEDF
ncbi:MAG TPA: nicotinate phosphoribosyltransferase [Parachlamydiaceae bacterium]|nr:nicotinate phosphoribosyltransferase [Parachlamydiaceae bacterium]